MKHDFAESREHAERFAYDHAAVPGVNCLACRSPIGKDRDYQPIESFRRFGQMMFIHSDCESKVDAETLKVEQPSDAETLFIDEETA